MKILKLSKTIFWDVNYDELDEEKHARFIIERAFERGFEIDIFKVMKFYGKDKIIEESTHSRWLQDSTINLLCLLYNLKPTNFRCYELKLSNQIHYPY
ncbi:MAG: DUF6922 domain-containing protein [Cytophagales bacterium]